MARICFIFFIKSTSCSYIDYCFYHSKNSSFRQIKRLYEKYADNFKNKVYTSKEIEYCESKKSNKFQSYAGRFAAKEAVFKAISQGFSNKYQINWKDIEILNDDSGRPYVNLNNINFVEGIKRLCYSYSDCSF